MSRGEGRKQIQHRHRCCTDSPVRLHPVPAGFRPPGVKSHFSCFLFGCKPASVTVWWTKEEEKISKFILHKLWGADDVGQRSESTNSYSNVSSAARTEVSPPIIYPTVGDACSLTPFSVHRAPAEGPNSHRPSRTLSFGPVFCSPVHPGASLGGWQLWSTWSWTIFYVSLSTWR